MVLTVRMFKENEVHVADHLSENEANDIAIELTKQKFEAMGINTEEMDIAILREVTE